MEEISIIQGFSQLPFFIQAFPSLCLTAASQAQVGRYSLRYPLIVLVAYAPAVD